MYTKTICPLTLYKQWLYCRIIKVPHTTLWHATQMKLLLLALVRFSLSMNRMKGTGALPLGRITVVSTGDLLPFLHIEGVNVYLSRSILYTLACAGRDNSIVSISFLIKVSSSWLCLASVLIVCCTKWVPF